LECGLVRQAEFVDGLKGLAEITKHLLYEVLGLVLPGGLFALGITVVIDPAWAKAMLGFAAERP